MFALSVRAQDKTALDSLKSTQVDSLQRLHCQQATEKREEEEQQPTFHGRPWRTPLLWHGGPEVLNSMFFEQPAEFYEALPGLRVARTGDVGYPTFALLFGRPQRFTRLQLDGVVWPVGMYGQTNLTAIPETAADHVIVDPTEGALVLESLDLHARTTWTYIEHADGPFGSDATRIRLRRPLSSHLRAYLSGTFANADDQPRPEGVGPLLHGYDAQRLYARVERDLKWSGYVLRYRFLRSMQEVAMLSPLFLEQFPQTIEALYKEDRLLHSIQLAATAQQADTLLERSRFDRWHLGLQYWDTREEHRDDPLARLIKHRRTIYTVSGLRRLGGERWFGEIDGAVSRHELARSTIEPGTQVRTRLDGRFAWKGSVPWFAFTTVGFRWYEHFPLQVEGNIGAVGTLREGLSAFIMAESQSAIPEPGESRNTIPGVLSPATALQSMRWHAVRAGLRIRRSALFAQAQATQGVIEKGFRLIQQDSTVQLVNAERRELLASLDAMVEWRPVPGLQMSGCYSRWFQHLSNVYLTGTMPRDHLRLQAETGHAFFQGDLLVSLHFEVHHYGERRTFRFDPSNGGLTAIRSPGFWSAAVLLKLYFKDAIIFLNYDNLFGTKAEWRYVQPIRSTTFRLGVNWLLLD